MKVEQASTKINATTFWHINCQDCKFDKNLVGEQKDEIQCDILYKVFESNDSENLLCKQKIRFRRY